MWKRNTYNVTWKHHHFNAHTAFISAVVVDDDFPSSFYFLLSACMSINITRTEAGGTMLVGLITSCLEFYLLSI